MIQKEGDALGYVLRLWVSDDGWASDDGPKMKGHISWASVDGGQMRASVDECLLMDTS